MREFRQITTCQTQYSAAFPRSIVPAEHVLKSHLKQPHRDINQALRCASRVLRWRQDKPLDEINTLDDLKEMLATYG
jgi:DNA ligase-1